MCCLGCLQIVLGKLDNVLESVMGDLIHTFPLFFWFS
jgi:hypothetical protein